MKTNIIKQLNELNTQFYQAVAEPFDVTRQQPWAGWEIALPTFKEILEKPGSICTDIGCGNARLAVYLNKQIKNKDWKYIGLDNSKELLAKAKHTAESVSIKTEFIHNDLITDLIENNSLNIPFESSLISLFGVLHHIPSLELREKLLEKINELTYSGTTLILSTWQFAQDQRLMNKTIEPSQVGTSKDDLEPHDYILSWDRGVTAYRYCHFTSDAELEFLLKETGWVIQSKFAADGKTNELNHYFVLGKA